MTFYSPTDSIWGVRYRTQIPSPVVVVPPTQEPLTVDQLKQHLRIMDHQGDAGEDAELTDLIRGGREFVEDYTGRAIVDQTLEMVFDGYPDPAIIPLLRPPLIDIVSLNYLNDAGQLAAVDPGDLYVDRHPKWPRLQPAYAVTWPTPLGMSSSVRVRWRAGYANLTGSPKDDVDVVVPAWVRTAIKLHAEAHYDREMERSAMDTLLARAASVCKPYCVDIGIA